MQLEQIGIIKTSLKSSQGAPIQPASSNVSGIVQIDEKYADALQDLDGFERIWLIFWCHKSKPVQMQVVPYMDNAPHGVFATRAPSRPNPIGISCVKLDRIDGLVLHVSDVDILDGTPLLDIKPYVPQFDVYPTERNGWLDQVDSKRIQKGQADQRFQQD